MWKIVMTVDYRIAIVTDDSMGQSPLLAVGCRHARRGRVLSRSRPPQCRELTKIAIVAGVNESSSFPYSTHAYIVYRYNSFIHIYCQHRLLFAKVRVQGIFIIYAVCFSVTRFLNLLAKTCVACLSIYISTMQFCAISCACGAW